MTSIDFVLVCHVLQVFDEELKLGFQVCYSNGQYLLTSACFCNRRKFLLCVCVGTFSLTKLTRADHKTYCPDLLYQRFGSRMYLTRYCVCDCIHNDTLHISKQKNVCTYTEQVYTNCTLMNSSYITFHNALIQNLLFQRKLLANILRLVHQRFWLSSSVQVQLNCKAQIKGPWDLLWKLRARSSAAFHLESRRLQPLAASRVRDSVHSCTTEEQKQDKKQRAFLFSHSPDSEPVGHL